jgi:microcystin-dependent protein
MGDFLMAYLGFVPSGVVLPFAGATAPQGWILCDGSAVSRSTYAALFSAISTAHGSGDGSTTFNLPDYRGRIMRRRDGGIARDPDRASRTAANSGGNTGDNVGSVQGEATKKNGLTASAASSSVSGSISQSAHSHRAYVEGGSNRDTGTGGGIAAGAFATQTHFTDSQTPSISHSLTAAAQTITIGAGDNETRPINAYVNYIIKI